MTGGSATLAWELAPKTPGLKYFGSLYWNGTGTNVFRYNTTELQSKGNKCAKINPNDVEVIVHGAIDQNRSAGGVQAGVKGAVNAKLCVDSSLNLFLLPGQTFKL